MSHDDINSHEDLFGFDTYGPFANVVYLQGQLVPLAHVKGISEVVDGLGVLDNGDGTTTEEYGFTVGLTGSLNDDFRFADGAILTYESEEEAERARLELTRRIDDYYGRLTGGGKLLGKRSE